MEKTTKIDGYDVTLEVYQERGETRSHCYIERGNANGSLDLALDQGILSTNDGDVHISPKVADKIEAWALANGY
jgi:hypothetical protein